MGTRRVLVIDLADNRAIITNLDPDSILAFNDEEFTAVGGGQSQYQLAADIDALTKIDVFINDRGPIKETTFYTRDTVNDRINLTSSVPEGTLVRIRVFS